MENTQTSVQDDFSQPQTSDTFETGPWEPINSERFLNASLGASTEITGGAWTFSANDANQIFTLEYIRQGGTTYDLSNVASITLEGVTINPGSSFDVQLRLIYDNSLPQTTGFVPLMESSVTFDLSQFFQLDNVTVVEFGILATSGTGSGSIAAITSAFICVAKDTMILMADGKETPIQNIKRGDFVAGDTQIQSKYKVARLIKTPLSASTPVKIVKINKNAIEPNYPNRDLIMSSGHPILYNGVRRRAKLFKKYPGVKYSKIPANKILPIDDNKKTYSLYNLQFQHDGSFVANGVVVDSVPVKSSLMPLPKELYFTKAFYIRPKKVFVPKLERSILVPNRV